MSGLRALLIVAAGLTLACGGGGSGVAGGGGTITPGLAAAFTPDQPAPVAGSSTMAPGGAQGDTITVLVNVTGINALRSASFDLIFDAGALEFLGSTPGNALELSGQTPIYVAAANGGILTVAVNLSGPGSVDINGTQALVGLSFRVEQAGSFPLVYQGPLMLNGNQFPINANWFAGTLSAN